jgi:hypothetical protein
MICPVGTNVQVTKSRERKTESSQRDKDADFHAQRLDREHASFLPYDAIQAEVDEDDMDDDELRAQVLQAAQKQQHSSRPRRHGGNHGR